MPELPEVETIRRGLEKHLVGKKLLGIEILDPRLSQGHTVNRFGCQVAAIRRFGKGLVIDLANGYSLAVHIKMTGRLLFRVGKVGDLPNKHTRAILHLDHDANLYFNDVRRFGWINTIKTSQIKNILFFKELGPEPFRNFTLKYFQSTLKKYSTPIKSLLLDQKKISGLGNIYANDALNLARINPLRKCSDLKNGEVQKLYQAIHIVLKKGLKLGGASQNDYVDVLGQRGNYQKYFLVYDREGQKCFNCGGIIKKIQLSGRGTYYCENCQK